MTAEEFEELYAQTVARLTGQLYVMLGDLHEAQDVVQEAFVKGWSRRRQLERDGRPEAWIRTVAWRLAVSRWRFRRRSAEAWRRSGALALRLQGPCREEASVGETYRSVPSADFFSALLFNFSRSRTRMALGDVAVLSRPEPRQRPHHGLRYSLACVLVELLRCGGPQIANRKPQTADCRPGPCAPRKSV
ncbi:RNA polymerase sigma factor [Streptomyces sp. ET3-23]|uniref:RNA polymerase sigma factor n=1 Tax=Streptomyces sp. ET3-23 TaxID=2885643 RepID=UPI001D1025D9|nr:RNA polymerase sigma factor [Streptomyces sp. ET3-23]MCC2277679.1 RNA polymerase sigma factor [Streptomyces sp. ET3-23]